MGSGIFFVNIRITSVDEPDEAVGNLLEIAGPRYMQLRR